jgi:hypothetical protein
LFVPVPFVESKPMTIDPDQPAGAYRQLRDIRSFAFSLRAEIDAMRP